PEAEKIVYDFHRIVDWTVADHAVEACQGCEVVD
ncbi:hypothetical protein ACJ72_08274, partial [Emergomyces africanus]